MLLNVRHQASRLEMKKQLRAKSHRLPLRRKYTILKKIKEHKRKVNRDLRRNPEKKRKPRTDRGVPNSCPFKEEILLDMEKLKQLKEREQEAKRAEILAKRKQLREAKLNGNRSLGNLETLAKDAEKRDAMFQKKNNEAAVVSKQNSDALHDNSAKAFYKEFRKVIEAADVILEVLDARDPIGTRCKTVEQAVLDAGANKRLVLLLNKADLVPKENLTQWLKYLRNELPAIAFKASTQMQSTKLGRGRNKFLKSSQPEIQTSNCLGADTLMTLLGNYARNKGIKTAIRVGVVGLPNVGKSSIINSLKRSKSCNVGAVPGVTKMMQEVALDSKIMLLDSPGIVMATGDASDTTIALRNALRIDSLEDAIAPVEVILKRTGKEYMMLQYNLSNFETTQEFLCILAKRTGQLRKGAVPDVFGAAKKILHEWNTGKIKYFTCPPETFSPTTHIAASIVADMAKEFSLDDADFNQKETHDIEQLPSVKPSTTVAIETMGFFEGKPESQDDVSVMECDDNEKVSTNGKDNETTQVKIGNSKPVVGTKDRLKKSVVFQKKSNPELLLPGNQRSNKAKRLQMKKAKKDQARREKVGEKLASDMEVAFSGLGAN